MTGFEREVESGNLPSSVIPKSCCGDVDRPGEFGSGFLFAWYEDGGILRACNSCNCFFARRSRRKTHIATAPKTRAVNGMPTPKPMFIDLSDWEGVADGFDAGRKEALEAVDADMGRKEALEPTDIDVAREETLETIDTNPVAILPMVVNAESPPGIKKVSVALSHLQAPQQYWSLPQGVIDQRPGSYQSKSILWTLMKWSIDHLCKDWSIQQSSIQNPYNLVVHIHPPHTWLRSLWYFCTSRFPNRPTLGHNNSIPVAKGGKARWQVRNL